MYDKKIQFPAVKRFMVLFAVTLVFLLVPFFGNLVGNGFNWTTLDFVVAGVLIFVLGFAIELVRANVSGILKKGIYVLFIIAILLLLWVEMAVGIFGSPIAGN